MLAGVQDVDPVASDTARSYRFRRDPDPRGRLAHDAAVRDDGTSAGGSVALILTVTGELLIGGAGIGGALAVARESGAIASMYSYVIVAGLLGVASTCWLDGSEQPHAVLAPVGPGGAGGMTTATVRTAPKRSRSGSGLEPGAAAVHAVRAADHPRAVVVLSAGSTTYFNPPLSTIVAEFGRRGSAAIPVRREPIRTGRRAERAAHAHRLWNRARLRDRPRGTHRHEPVAACVPGARARVLPRHPAARPGAGVHAVPGHRSRRCGSR